MRTDIQRQIKRKDQLDAGLFDGRYRQKVIVNKKKKQSPSQSAYEDFPFFFHKKEKEKESERADLEGDDKREKKSCQDFPVF